MHFFASMYATRALLLPLLLLWGSAAANEPAVAANSEIEALFSVLERSACRFNRNGSWHGASEATAHLRRKYAHLQKKGRIESTEAFIDLAASRSSVSGKPYLVQCDQDAAVESKVWFHRKLGQIRSIRNNRSQR